MENTATFSKWKKFSKTNGEIKENGEMKKITKKMMSYVYGLSTKYKLPKLNIAEITDLSVESVSRILTVMEFADKGDWDSLEMAFGANDNRRYLKNMAKEIYGKKSYETAKATPTPYPDVTLSDISLKLDEINRYLKALCDVWGAKFRT